MILNSNGELSKGFAILLQQVLKMLNLNPELIIEQINAIHGLLKRFVAQQDEILQRLERLENGTSDFPVRENKRQSPDA
jgi:hypothetical protein